jgi:hypothetical protein
MIQGRDDPDTHDDMMISGLDVRLRAEYIKGLAERTVSQVFSIDVDDIRGTSRGLASVALARQTAMYLTHVVCGVPLTDVGRAFGRDRTTVRHACAVIEDRRDNPAFDRTIVLLEGIVARLTCVSGLETPTGSLS